MEFYQEIEKELLGKTRKKIWRPFMSAIKEYKLVEDGDKICVCVSGGKDSILLAKCMQQFQRHTPLDVELKFLCMDPGYAPENRRRIEENCRLLNIPVEFFETDVFEAVDRMDCNACFMCARMRRGCLYRHAQALGCNKLALGHHFDDVIETTLMAMLYGGQIQAMPPMLEAKNFPGLRLIRPMYAIRERDIVAWRDDYGLEFLQCACRVTRKGTDSRRQYVKRLIQALDADHPKVSQNLFNSVHTVQLDTLVGWKHRGVAHTFLENLEDD